MCHARHLMMLYISLKFHENILKGFQVKKRTQNDRCQISKGNNYKRKLYRQELRFLCSARLLMMFNISMKFHDNGKQIVQLTRNYRSLISKGNDSKMYIQELQFLWSPCCLMIRYISMKLYENILNDFQVMERTRTDRQTDRHPRQKQYVSTPVRGRYNHPK